MAIDGKAQEVTQDLPCVRCGYNLRTLGVDGRCPECGLGVVLTLELGGELERARPGYIRRLAAGCWLLFSARAFASCWTLLVASASRGVWPIRPTTDLPLFAREIILVACAVYGIGNLMLAEREHPRLPLEMPRTARALWLFGAAMCAGNVLLLLADFRTTRVIFASVGFVWGLREAQVTTLTIAAIAIVCPVLEMRRLVYLSRRVADARLHEYSIIAGLGGSLSTAAMLMFMIWQPSVSRLSMLYAWLAVVIALLLFWIWTGCSSLMGAVYLTRASRRARERWERHSPDQA